MLLLWVREWGAGVVRQSEWWVNGDSCVIGVMVDGNVWVQCMMGNVVHGWCAVWVSGNQIHNTAPLLLKRFRTSVGFFILRKFCSLFKLSIKEKGRKRKAAYAKLYVKPAHKSNCQVKAHVVEDSACDLSMLWNNIINQSKIISRNPNFTSSLTLNYSLLWYKNMCSFS